jgi:ubiquinone/menaquinone biosynthesis C-methylase UbiE
LDLKDRRPEGQMIDEAILRLFSRVSKRTGRAAAFRVHRILRKVFGSDLCGVDIGTGPGMIPLYLQWFHPNAYLVGLDISISMLKEARRNSKPKGVCFPLLAANGESLPFKEKSMDLITSFFSLHHVDHPGMLLKEADRVLRPDGSLLIMDFRRDMPKLLFYLLNICWQTMFWFSPGRFGFRDSVYSSWQPKEIENILAENRLHRFRVHVNPLELWIVERHG